MEVRTHAADQFTVSSSSCSRLAAAAAMAPLERRRAIAAECEGDEAAATVGAAFERKDTVKAPTAITVAAADRRR